MPFNIELVTGEIVIKIQVVRKVINVYFNGELEKAADVREHWNHLNQHFINSFPEVGPEEGVSLTSGVFHRKKEHTNTRESTIVHLHIPFMEEITSELFSKYLRNLYNQQIVHDENYQFFRDANEMESIIKTFNYYYDDYKGSLLEAEYEEDTKLTSSEENEHKIDVNNAKKNNPNKINLASLLLASVLSQQPPIRPGTAEEIEETNQIGCPIM